MEAYNIMRSQSLSKNQSKPRKKNVFERTKSISRDFVSNDQHLKQYINELKNNNAPCIKETYANIGYFLRFINKLSLEDISGLHLVHIKQYEEHLAQRIENKEIKKNTSYTKLRFLAHFINYLKQENVVQFQYQVPLRFKGSPIVRDNEYVTNQDRLHFIETILNHNSRNFFRDIAICLIIIDLGCRPIEIAKLELDDFSFTDSTIILNCRKSGQRKLKIDPFVAKYLKQFVGIRRSLPASNNFMFLLGSGDPLSSSTITSMIRYYVKKAFGECRFSAKSLRHTCITNQLNNRNDIKTVAHAAGHKHLVSTLHYFYRDVELLLEHSLPYNPMEGIEDIHEFRPDVTV